MAELKSFDRVAHVYDETRGLPPAAEREIAAGLARMMRDVTPAPLALEVGIGTGRMALPLAAEGVRVAGIDISPKMLAVLLAKARAGSVPGKLDVMLAEASRPPLRAASFDALLFVHILHLVPDASATLQATLPLVRPGGAVILGNDEGHIGKRGEAERIIRLATLEVAAIALTEWEKRGAALTAADAVLRASAAEVSTQTLAAWSHPSTGRRMLERLRNTDYSSSWMIPEAALPAIIERVTPELDRLYGGLDREEQFERKFIVTVARLPA